MKLSKEERREILSRCDELLKDCSGCQIKINITKENGSSAADTNCKINCQTGIELQNNGLKLMGKITPHQSIPNRTKKERDELVKQFKELRSAGLSWKAISERLGVALPTIHKWKNKYLL